MHNLKPKTNYRILRILVAVPDSLDYGTVADGLNEMLRPAVMCEDAVIADYSLNYLRPLRMITTSDEPYEGEPFESFDPFDPPK